MKKLFLLFASAALLMSVNSCAKCYVCTDKEDDTFVKQEVCDKDYDKDDIDDIIDAIEDNSDAKCHAKSRIL